MTRLWADKLRGLQENLAELIRAERTAQSAQLPAGLQGAQFMVSVSGSPDRSPLKAFTIQVMPAANSQTKPEVTDKLTGFISIPCRIRIKTEDEKDALTILNEMQGLIVDGSREDSSLDGVTGGFDDPAHEIGPIEVGVGEMFQEVVVRYQVR